MAKLPTSVDKIVENYGPHKAYTPVGGFHGHAEPDKLVKTHCCFCGMQCGIQLKVKENTVVGFEPWMEFPFNEGRMCPKGVARYLQNNHPDRLLSPIEKGGRRRFPAGRLGDSHEQNGIGNKAHPEYLWE